jgi:hypothetical protein
LQNDAAAVINQVLLRRLAAQELAQNFEKYTGSTSNPDSVPTDEERSTLRQAADLLRQGPGDSDSIPENVRDIVKVLKNQSDRHEKVDQLIAGLISPVKVQGVGITPAYQSPQTALVRGVLNPLEAVVNVLALGNSVNQDGSANGTDFWRAHVDMRNDIADEVANRVKALSKKITDDREVSEFLDRLQNEMRTDPLDMDNQDLGFWKQAAQDQRDRFDHVVEMVQEFKSAHPGKI